MYDKKHFPTITEALLGGSAIIDVTPGLVRVSGDMAWKLTGRSDEGVIGLFKLWPVFYADGEWVDASGSRAPLYVSTDRRVAVLERLPQNKELTQ